MRRVTGQLSEMLGIMVLLLVGLASPVYASLLNYEVTIDTSALLGSVGYVDLQFNPGTITAPAAQAALTLFSSDATLQSGVQVDGDVAGVLPGIVLFSNTTPFNAVLQPMTFGNTASFHLNFSGAFTTMLSGANTLFSASLLDGDFNSLLTVDPIGTLLQFDLAPGGGITTTTFNAAIGTPSVVGVVAVAAVPVPAAVVLFGTGLAGLVGWQRKRLSKMV